LWCFRFNAGAVALIGYPRSATRDTTELFPIGDGRGREGIGALAEKSSGNAHEIGHGSSWYYADVPNRLVGYLLDAIILTILSLVGAVIISVLFGPVVTLQTTGEASVSVDRGLAFANAGLGSAISAVYFIGSWRRLGGSPGQRLLRMRVWTYAGAGRPVTIGQGVIRWLFIGLPLALEATLSVALSGRADTVLLLVLLAWYLVLLVSTARSPTKRGIHDRAARTVVTKAGRVAPLAEVAERPKDTRVH
jgi:uncharacterized RDD family membrane protein YckC